MTSPASVPRSPFPVPCAGNTLSFGQAPGLTRVVFADCTQAARDLAASHLAGPVASAALAEGLVAVSLLSSELGTPEEAVTLHIQAQGPIGSLLVEATYEGTLRGYTGKKILNDLDATLVAPPATPLTSDGGAVPPQRGPGAAEAPATAAAGGPPAPLDLAFGTGGQSSVMVSLPGKVLAQSSAPLVGPPRPLRALEAFYGAGAQRQVKAAINVALDGEGRIATAQGALIERMPGSDPAEFDRLASASSVLCRAMYGAGDAAPESPLPAPAFTLPLSHSLTLSTRPLRFACRCSREKALAILAALPPEERAALAAAPDKPIDIYCHMCGKCHTFEKCEIEKIWK